MGIYDEVICAVTGIFHRWKQSVRTLFPYVIGMGAGIVGLSFAISQLFASYPLQTAMLFIGLIFGGLPLLLPKVAGKRPSVAELAVFALFFGLIVWMQFWGEGHSKLLAVDAGTMLSLFLIGALAAAAMVIPGVSGSMLLMSLGYYTPLIHSKLLAVDAGTMLSLFLIGALAAAAMVIPGVSGSMLLMSLGYYTPLIDHINAFVTAVVTLDFSTVWYCMGILAPFGIGVLIGAFVIAKLVEYLLKRYERMTYFAILGLVASSPIAVFAGIGVGGASAGAWFAGIILFVAGAAIAGLLGK